MDIIITRACVLYTTRRILTTRQRRRAVTKPFRPRFPACRLRLQKIHTFKHTRLPAPSRLSSLPATVRNLCPGLKLLLFKSSNIFIGLLSPRALPFSPDARVPRRRRVRIRDWMLFDFEHVDESENTAPKRRDNWRATAWEIHPVIDMTVLN